MNSFHQNLKSFDSPSLDERVRQEIVWIRGIRRGDEQSFEELYRHYFPLLANYLMRFVQSRKVAEDLIHNVFFKVWENRKKIQPNGNLRAYLYTSVRNQ